MSFADLMKKPLPSKVTVESTEIEQDLATATQEIENLDTTLEAPEEEPVVTPAVKEEDDMDEDLEDIDLSDLSDEELDEMEEELRDSDLDDVVGDIEPVTLTPEEEKEADDLMSLAGTTELLRSELNVEECAAFLESARETQIAVFEGFLLDSDITTESAEDVVTEAKMYNKTIIRLSREDRKAQLYSVALQVSARAHKDPDYLKLQKVQKIRRVLKKRIQKKYHAEAVRRMKVYFNRLKNSKSNVLSALGKKIDK